MPKILDFSRSISSQLITPVLSLYLHPDPSTMQGLCLFYFPFTDYLAFLGLGIEAWLFISLGNPVEVGEKGLLETD